MAVERISKLDDPRLAPYRQLRQANATRFSGRFIAEGRLLVERLLASNFQTESVVLDEKHAAGLLPKVPEDIPTLLVPHAQIGQLVGFHFHRGVLACGRRKPHWSPEELGQRLGPHAMVAAISGVQDPENVGGIVRSCAAFGVAGLLLGQGCADPFSRRVLRVSMGTVLKLPLVDAHDLPRAIRYLSDRCDVEFAATVLAGQAESLSEARRPARFGLVFGSEAFGLPQPVQQACSRQITIPMHRGTDSLNVSVSVGIFLYHFTSVGSGR